MSPAMTVYALKSKFQNMLRPACRFLADNGVTANQVTVSTTILSAVAGSLVWLSAGARWTLAVVPCALFVRMALNALDGMLAREHGMGSDVGAMLNELGDVVSDVALYLSLAVVPGCSAPLVVMAVVLGPTWRLHNYAHLDSVMTPRFVLSRPAANLEHSAIPATHAARRPICTTP